jgi:hypothetical protein
VKNHVVVNGADGDRLLREVEEDPAGIRAIVAIRRIRRFQYPR